MIILDACASFCAAAKEAFGPQIAEWIALAAIAGLSWWRTRKVQAAATAGIAVATEKARTATAVAHDTKLQLARIEGSLRPAALTPVPSSGTSGTFSPVEILGAPGGKPSMVNPDLVGPDDLTLSGETALPAPPRAPTIPATPSSKGRAP